MMWYRLIVMAAFTQETDSVLNHTDPCCIPQWKQGICGLAKSIVFSLAYDTLKEKKINN